MIQSGQPVDTPKSQKLSVTALLSLVFSFIPLVNILGILMGIRSLREIKKSNVQNEKRRDAGNTGQR